MQNHNENTKERQQRKQLEIPKQNTLVEQECFNVHLMILEFNIETVSIRKTVYTL